MGNMGNIMNGCNEASEGKADRSKDEGVQVQSKDMGVHEKTQQAQQQNRDLRTSEDDARCIQEKEKKREVARQSENLRTSEDDARKKKVEYGKY